MVEPEKTLVPTLSNHLMSWKRYVYDTNSFIKEDSIEHVMNIAFHGNFAPIEWKRCNLKTLVCCSYFICLNDHYLTLELEYFCKVF